MSPELMSQVAFYFTLFLSGVLALVALYLLPKLPKATGYLFDRLKAQTQLVENDLARTVLLRLQDLVRQRVLQVENTVIEGLKEKARDGKLTKEELADELQKVKLQTLNDIREVATLQGLWDLGMKLFVKDTAPGAGLYGWLDKELEAVVATLPPSGLQSPAIVGDGQLVSSAMKAGERKRRHEAILEKVKAAGTVVDGKTRCPCGQKSLQGCLADESTCQGPGTKNTIAQDIAEDIAEELPAVPPTAAS
jgi:hypothetical protein